MAEEQGFSKTLLDHLVQPLPFFPSCLWTWSSRHFKENVNEEVPSLRYLLLLLLLLTPFQIKDLYTYTYFWLFAQDLCVGTRFINRKTLFLF